jgi:hypothetical protein
MKHKVKLLAAAIVTGLGLQANPVAAESDSLKALSGEWWQWALSIPTAHNPMLDTSGVNCMVGQHGSTWFLAGLFGGGGPVMRNCTVPDNVSLFFPAVNSINFDTPNVCGQDATSLSVAQLRAFSASFIANPADPLNLLVVLDGRPVNTKRVRSKVFAVALPEDNVFDAPCATLGGFPSGIFAPAVDDGYYARLEPLKPGAHVLQIRASNQSGGFMVDVTYNLTVKRALLK